MKSMLLLVALTGLLSLGMADACSVLAFWSCSEAVDALNRAEEPPQEELCSILRNALNCFNELHSRCPDFGIIVQSSAAYHIHDLIDKIQELNETIQKRCGSEQNNSHDAAARCIENSQEYLMQETQKCAKNMIGPLLMEVGGGSYSEADIQCMIFSRMADCIKGKLATQCGELASQIFDPLMKQEARNAVTYGSNDSRCIQFFGGMRKKRSIVERMTSTKLVHMGELINKVMSVS